MSSDQPHTERLSGWRVRQRVESAGYGVSDDQLDQFTEWGLLRRDAPGYQADAAERVIEILEASQTAWSLPRRVVRLRGDFTRFPVPAGPLQRAFAELAPTIKAPIRKMQRVDDAWRWMA